ncbi:Reverse transcriptase-RNase H-integrase [Mycena sanguinolenta]|uniref:Reverse transcriptase-RNase H-integrase n=1 Tax=Mycena sanguinolenta TaxID=230812 RepID=A0A8H7CSR2_9AGAR|nr:Reverse transcriptase-RNase H-integrase [Mycena sanguinolenta]
MATSTSIDEDLETLHTAIKNLPASAQSGRHDNPLAKFLTPGLTKGDDPKPDFPTHKDGAYLIFNQQWEHVFQKKPGDPDNKLENLVSRGRGKHGLILAHAWAAHYTTVVEPGERELIQLRVQTLLNLITTFTNTIGSTAVNENSESAEEQEHNSADEIADRSKKRKKAAKTKGASSKKAKKANTEGGTGDDIQESQAEPSVSSKSTRVATKPSKKTDNKPSEDSDSSSDSSDEETAEQRASAKLVWALSQYRPPKKALTGSAKVWKFNCRYCNKYCCTPRSEGINEWDQETERIKIPSNFLQHADTCSNRPPAQSWEQYQLAHERKHQNLPPLPMSSNPSPHEVEQEMMSDFIRRGIENPAKVVTNRSYRKYLVEAIVEDDLAYSTAEGGGTLKLLTHMAPRGVKARVSHQTVRRDLDALHKALKSKLRGLLKGNDSKFSIASDIDWILREHVLDLIPLDGDHSGKSVGKLIFCRLKKDGLAGSLMASAADHASSNGPLNRTIARKCAALDTDATSARNIQIGCGGHCTNLVAQKITGTLGMSPKVEEVDLYNETRKYPLVYDPAKDPVVVQEMELMAAEAKKEAKNVSGDSDMGSDVEEVPVESEGSTSEDSSDSDEEQADDGGEWEDVELATATRSARKNKKARKVFTPVDKVHSVAVHILRSEIRQKAARWLIRRKVEKTSRHLVFVRSMKVRWNTILAELERAKLLQPAFDAFVNEMPNGLTGKVKRVAQARKKKWEMSSADWEFIEKLIKALEVLKMCTLEFSKKGVPTITKVLALYKLMEVTLTDLAIHHRDNEPTLSAALFAGADVATTYISNALVGDYVLLGAVLHPAVRVAYFQSDQWDPSVAIRARRLLLNIAHAGTKSNSATPQNSVFAMAMALKAAPILSTATGSTTATVASDGKDEVELYCGNISPVADDFDDPLGWWKDNSGTLKYMGRVARDILAIPGVSISVERPFFESQTHFV